jgi:hypothetical protein
MGFFPEEADFMTDRDCSGSGLARAEDVAFELYQLAALLLGKEAEALGLVEEFVSEKEVDPCAPESPGEEATRRELIAAAVARMSEADPAGFAPPVADGSGFVTCIENDDLDAMGVTPADLTELISGGGRERMREWLNQLPLVQRAIFVQRAVLGWDNATIVGFLPEGWQPQQVSEVFRQALCSLATSLIHLTTAQK